MHIKPKKKLGQNFLIDKNIQKKIINACEVHDTDVILEIGPGRGELTVSLAEAARRVYAIELDSGLCEVLKEKLTNHKNVRIINQDILRTDLKNILDKGEEPIKVIGNIPYYISSPIIEHLLRFREMISEIFITVQKEFARRVCAKPGTKDYGSFSCFVQYYTQPKIIFQIKRGSFFPVPDVNSCLLKLQVNKTTLLNNKRQEEQLFKIIRAAFNQRRKTLRNSLRGVVSMPRLNIFFERNNINSKIRPEMLSLEDFINLLNT